MFLLVHVCYDYGYCHTFPCLEEQTYMRLSLLRCIWDTKKTKQVRLNRYKVFINIQQVRSGTSLVKQIRSVVVVNVMSQSICLFFPHSLLDIHRLNWTSIGQKSGASRDLTNSDRLFTFADRQDWWDFGDNNIRLFYPFPLYKVSYPRCRRYFYHTRYMGFRWINKCSSGVFVLFHLSFSV